VLGQLLALLPVTQLGVLEATKHLLLVDLPVQLLLPPGCLGEFRLDLLLCINASHDFTLETGAL